MMRHAVGSIVPARRDTSDATSSDGDHENDSDEEEDAEGMDVIGALRPQQTTTLRKTATKSTGRTSTTNTMNTMNMISNSGNNISIQRNQHITIDNGASHISPAVLGCVQIPNIATMISAAPQPVSQQTAAPTTVVTTTTTVAQPAAATTTNGGGPPRTIPLNEKFDAYEREKRSRLALKFEQFVSTESSSCSDDDHEDEDDDEEESRDDDEGATTARGHSTQRENNQARGTAKTTSSTLADLMETEAEECEEEDAGKKNQKNSVHRSTPTKRKTHQKKHRPHGTGRKRNRKEASFSSSSRSEDYSGSYSESGDEASSQSYSSDYEDDENSSSSGSVHSHARHRHRHSDGHHRSRHHHHRRGGSRSHRKRGRRYISIQDDCFLCAWGNKFHDGIRVPHIQAMYQMIDKFYGRMTNEDLANMVHMYYRRKVYRHGCGMQMLMPYVIVQHLEGNHSMAAVSFLIESVKDYKHIRAIAKDSIYQADGTIDYKAFAMHEKAQSKLEKLYLMKIQNMNFNNGATTEDLNSKGAYANLMPMFSQKEPTGSSAAITSSGGRRSSSSSSSRRAIMPPRSSSGSKTNKKKQSNDKQSQLVLPRKSSPTKTSDGTKGSTSKPIDAVSLTEFEM